MIAFENDIEKLSKNDLAQKAFESLREEMESGAIGYYTLPEIGIPLLEEVKSIKTDTFTQIVVIGIGGSSLGIKAIDSMLRPANKEAKEILFFENSDPVTISSLMQRVRPEEAAFFVISKSGSTIETTSIFKTVIAHFRLELDAKDNKRVFVITDEGSDLDKFAKHYVLRAFHIPHNVGGRFSVLSAVGVVPLAFAGYNVLPILKGALGFVERFFAHKENHLLEKALFYYKNAQTTSITVLFSYADSMEQFNKWFVQLWGESLGKIDAHKRNTGFTPIGIIGAVDQHSFLQLIVEGPRDKTVTFVRVEDFGNDLRIADVSLKHLEQTNFVNNKTFAHLINEQSKAVMQSVSESGIMVDAITLDTLSEQNVGKLIVYFQLLTSLVGFMSGVDTYNQNGVELGKKILYNSLSKQ